MKTYKNLYPKIYSIENLVLALSKARKRKTNKQYVVQFESEKEKNLEQLQYELRSLTYSPRPLTNFIVRDPKTRRISASAFRDRVVHHALCNIIEPIFERNFIHDSFANQKGKGTHKAIKRLEKFTRKVCFTDPRYHLKEDNTAGYALKADIRRYFDTVDHEILLQIMKRKIKDKNTIWLIRTILQSPKSPTASKGMPLGNLTSQFFANIYLNELDRFVKHELKTKYYIRYVYDFVILHRDKAVLERWKSEINEYLRRELRIDLHPEKSGVVQVKNGVTLLGFRLFYHYKLLKKSNAKRIWKRLERFKQEYNEGRMNSSDMFTRLEGWLSYAEFGNTYNLRIRVVSRFNEIVLELDQ
jgi:retron-type reverse transcriptase